MTVWVPNVKMGEFAWMESMATRVTAVERDMKGLTVKQVRTCNMILPIIPPYCYF